MRISLLLLSLGLASCGALRPTRVPPAPGPIPARIPSGPVSAAPPPSKPLPEPPLLDTTATATLDDPVPPAVEIPKSVKRPPAPRRRRVAARKPVPPPPPPPAAVDPAPEFPEPEPGPLLQLGEVLGPQQRSELLRQTDALLSICDRAVSTATPRLLTPTQADLLNRVRTLSQLSRDARERSPAEARNLGERARLFAERLLEELR
jgi:hypothetical protein